MSRLCAPHPAHARAGADREASDWEGGGKGDGRERNRGRAGPRKAVTWRKGTLAKVTGAGWSRSGGSAERGGWRHSLKVESEGFDDHGSREMGKG